MSLLDNLRAARELLSDPARWTTKTLARAKDQTPIRTTEPDACQWCAVGALLKVGAKPEGGEYDLLNAKCVEMYPGRKMTIFGVNDVLGRIEVLKVYDAVISDLEAAA